MEMNILTWNIDWFRNGKRSLLNQPEKYFETDISKDCFDKIIEIMLDFLKKPNSIVFLQEAPHKAKDNANNWKKVWCYNKLKQIFDANDYDVKFNYCFSSLRYTLSISKKSIFQELKSYKPKNNRTIGVCFEQTNLIILGVHMPTNFNSGDANSNMWDELIDFTNTTDTPLIVIGDFNAYLYCNDKNTASKYKELLKFMEDITPKNIATFIGNTQIDHVLINNCFNKDKYVITTQVESISFADSNSDHKYIKIKIIDSK